MECSKGGPKREVYSNTGLSQETIKFSNTHPNLTPKGDRDKTQQIKPKASRRREITKIRPEINDIEIKRTVEQMNKSRSSSFERIRLINPSQTYQKEKRKDPNQ